MLIYLSEEVIKWHSSFSRATQSPNALIVNMQRLQRAVMLWYAVKSVVLCRSTPSAKNSDTIRSRESPEPFPSPENIPKRIFHCKPILSLFTEGRYFHLFFLFCEKLQNILCILYYFLNAYFVEYT